MVPSNPMLPEQPQPHLALGVTGHRAANPSFQHNSAAIEHALDRLFSQIAALSPDNVRLHSLLVDGVDQVAARLGLQRQWRLVAPLPFGAALNRAINARPTTVEDAERLVRGEAAVDPAVQARAHAISMVLDQAHLFELADRDSEIAGLFVDALHYPDDHDRQRAFEASCSDAVALAGQVMIERVDLLVAVWDRKARNLPGGTGHTVVRALHLGTPVLLIDPLAPEHWTVCTRPEELWQPAVHDPARVEAALLAAMPAPVPQSAPLSLERWHMRSSRLFGLYRWIENTFGGGTGGVTRFEQPDEIAAGSAAPLLAAVSQVLADDPGFTARVKQDLLPGFAWADGVSTWLSDAYRSGMCANFLFSMLAVILGLAYLPLGLAEHKWLFASVELLLLLGIVGLTLIGRRLRWHQRWFETRRVAEYLRHAPGMLLLGVSRHTARWPRGERQEWPEQFARNAVRAIGLPKVRIERTYLRRVLAQIVASHVSSQHRYHRDKAARLNQVHRRLDQIAQGCFVLAVLLVSTYLVLAGGGAAGVLPPAWPERTAKLFTFLGVVFPTLGAGISGIRYFADFERFAAISDATADKLSDIETRIGLLLSGDERSLTYAAASDLVHAIDQTVVEEIASWQAVFGGKHLSLPA